MTTTTPDIEDATVSAAVADVLVIDKENSFDLDLVYGEKTGAKPHRHDINQLTSQYDWKQPYTVWMAYGECDPIWLKELLTTITVDSKIIFIDACPVSEYSLDKSMCNTLRPYIEKINYASSRQEHLSSRQSNLLIFLIFSLWINGTPSYPKMYSQITLKI